MNLLIADLVGDRKASLPCEDNLSRFLGRIFVFYIGTTGQRTRKSTTEEGDWRDVENQTEYLILNHVCTLFTFLFFQGMQSLRYHSCFKTSEILLASCVLHYTVNNKFVNIGVVG